MPTHTLKPTIKNYIHILLCVIDITFFLYLETNIYDESMQTFINNDLSLILSYKKKFGNKKKLITTTKIL